MLEHFYNDIPIGRENAITYPELCEKWRLSERQVRKILHELSFYDPMDNMILIRSSQGKGFYKTDNVADIERYKKECTNRAKRTFVPLRKIKRVLKELEKDYEREKIQQV